MGYEQMVFSLYGNAQALQSHPSNPPTGAAGPETEGRGCSEPKIRLAQAETYGKLSPLAPTQ